MADRAAPSAAPLDPTVARQTEPIPSAAPQDAAVGVARQTLSAAPQDAAVGVVRQTEPPSSTAPLDEAVGARQAEPPGTAHRDAAIGVTPQTEPYPQNPTTSDGSAAEHHWRHSRPRTVCVLRLTGAGWADEKHVATASDYDRHGDKLLAMDSDMSAATSHARPRVLLSSGCGPVRYAARHRGGPARAAPASGDRAALALNLSRAAIRASRRAIARRRLELDEQGVLLRWAELHYGDELAGRLRRYLASRR